MFLSYLLIDTAADLGRPRPGRSWVRKPYYVHQRFCMAFPDGRRRANDPHFLAPFNPSDFAQNVHASRDAATGFLFRIDPLPGVIPSRHGIVVQSGSAIEPDWDYAFHNAPELLAAQPKVQPFDPAFTTGHRLCFRLRANPIVKRDGKRCPLLGEGEQRDWLDRKAVEAGFRVVRAEVSPEGACCGYKTAGGATIMLTHHAVRFDGLLFVTDPERLRHALRAGIGSAKAFGFGLISFPKCRE